jgi:hypothetical protein
MAELRLVRSPSTLEVIAHATRLADSGRLDEAGEEMLAALEMAYSVPGDPPADLITAVTSWCY